MKTFTVQYKRNSYDGLRNMKVEALNLMLAENIVREAELAQGNRIKIERTLDPDSTLVPTHTTVSFRKVQTPTTEFKP